MVDKDNAAIIIAAVSAALSILISVIVWLQERPSAKKRREQHKLMVKVATRALLLHRSWIEIYALRLTRSHVDSTFIDNFKVEAKLVNSAIDDAIAADLWNALIGSKPRSKTLFHKFRVVLLKLCSVNYDGNCFHLYENTGISYGLIRTLDQCRIYLKRQNETDPALLDELGHFISSDLYDRTVETAWTYDETDLEEERNRVRQHFQILNPDEEEGGAE